jgi:hypothetical protein
MVHRADTESKPLKTQVRLKPENPIQAVAQPEEKTGTDTLFLLLTGALMGDSLYGRLLLTGSYSSE